MKREIKFRAWDKIESQMLFSGIDYQLRLISHICQDEFADESVIGFSRLDWDRFDLMQFTGLKDKNGKEIYADDILFDGEHKFRVYAMYGGFGIKAPHWSGIMEDMVMGDDLIMQPLADAQTMSYISQSMEVIGNIYEHNHLLR